MEERTGNADQPGELNPGALFAYALEELKSTPGSGTRWTPLTVSDLQRELSQYSVSHLIGRGGMGAVYMARQDSLDRDVAIKILPPGIDSDDLQFAGRFKQEARAMAKFKHPGIVSVHDAGETPGGLLYFVMEFIEGNAVGKTIIGRLSNHTVTCTLTDDATVGGMILRQAAVTPFRDFESINFDGLSEAEALKSIPTPIP